MPQVMYIGPAEEVMIRSPEKVHFKKGEYVKISKRLAENLENNPYFEFKQEKKKGTRNESENKLEEGD